MNTSMPDRESMYKALLNKDSHFEGIFYFGVKTTGIFCRPTCRARKPRLKNIEFFRSPSDAIEKGYRPCKICYPLGSNGKLSIWIEQLIEQIRQNPEIRISDQYLKKQGIDPVRVRRWFKKNYGVTFQSYLRTLKMSSAYNKIKNGNTVIKTAFDSGYKSLSGFTESFRKAAGFSPIKSRQKNLVEITRIETPLGEMLAGSTDNGICLFEFIDGEINRSQINRLRKIFNAELIPGTNAHFDQLKSELKEYFNGYRKVFTVPLIIKGTPFQENVWKALLQIPYGQTRSYLEQAEMIGNSGAVRAVANANGRNRISIIVPCHRVIGSNGKLTGYGGGLWRKKYLLNLEGGKFS